MVKGVHVQVGPAIRTVEVVYVAFQPYGTEAVERFLRSYRLHAAGLRHRLTIALKGYVDSVERAGLVAQAHRAGAVAIEVPDRGFDIGTYLHVAAASSSETLCFLNSNSELLTADWLVKLVGALRRQGGGAVSATGSWESHSADQLRILPGHPPGIRRRATRLLTLLPRFAWFPNVHLRTNALAIDRTELLRHGFGEPGDKHDAWLFESGRSGLSASIRRSGKRVSVVGADGCAFAPGEWADSGTFWQGEQANLLVGDNQTRRFQHGDRETRQRLAEFAWKRPKLEMNG